MRILWVDCTDPVGEPRVELDARNGLAAERVNTPLLALECLKVAGYDAVVADFPMPEWTPEEFIEEVQRTHSGVPVVVRHARASIADAVRLIKLGAFHVIAGPPEAEPSEELMQILEQAAEHRRDCQPESCGRDVAQEPWKRFLVGESRAMRGIAETVHLVGPRRCTVLITGETGTGKELVARAIHMASARSHLPMVPVNCSALPEPLLEAELFGHVKGAFTGAINHRIGRFEQADRSTLFLDEIGDMAPDLQAKLLRVLQERELQRLGSCETIRLDVRVVAASNVDLSQRMEEGRFREDLYYRLNVVPIRVPPLRERAGDIPLLVHHFLDKFCRQEGIPPKTVSPETLDRISSYPWPGNVRQLENAVERAVALAGDRRNLYPGDFPLPASARRPLISLPELCVPDDGLDFERTVSRIERNILTQALERTRGNKKAAADMLRLKRTTLSAKLKSLEMEAV